MPDDDAIISDVEVSDSSSSQSNSSSSSDSESESEVEVVDNPTQSKPASKSVAKPSPTKAKAAAKRKAQSSDESDDDNNEEDTPAPKKARVEPVSSGSRPVSKDIVIQGGEAEKLVYKYLLAQNRPYLALQVSENLHGAVKKTQVTQVLENLVEQGAVVGKLFGKSKIYHVNQENLLAGDSSLISQLDQEVSSKQRALNDLKLELSQLKQAITALEATPGNAEGGKQCTDMAAEIEEKRSRLAAFEADSSSSKTQDIDKWRYRFHDTLKEWKLRRKACQEMMDMYLEHVSKTQKVFMREQGLESDEEHKLNIKDFIALAEELGCSKLPTLGKKKK